MNPIEIVSSASEDRETGSIVIVKKPRVNRVVVVVGTTGTGKSTIVNLLFNSSSADIRVDEQSCTKPCAVKSTSDSVTKQSRWLYNTTAGHLIGDTVGLGDPKKDNTEVVMAIKNFLQLIGTGVHCIVIVLRYPRLSREERLNLELIAKLFQPHWADGCIVVGTHYDGEMDENSLKSAINTWMGEEQTLREFFGKVKGGVILTDNALGRDFEDNEFVRRQCVERLHNFIDKCDTLIGPAPTKWYEIVYYYLEKLFGLHRVVDAGRKINDALKYLQASNHTSIGAGYCSICLLEIMNFEDMAYTNCNHRFHYNCIMRSVPKVMDPCPQCETPVHIVYRLQL